MDEMMMFQRRQVTDMLSRSNAFLLECQKCACLVRPESADRHVKWHYSIDGLVLPPDTFMGLPGASQKPRPGRWRIRGTGDR